MSRSYLLVYTTREGQTRKIANLIRDELQTQGHNCRLCNLLEQAAPATLTDYDCVIIGGSIYYGHHDKRLSRFIKQHKVWLESHQSAFFTVNLTARKADKNQPDNNPYLVKFLKRVAWQPKQLAVFAGALLYPKYAWYDRHVIRFIMWITKGVTDTSQTVEYTDWEKVRAFAVQLAQGK